MELETSTWMMIAFIALLTLSIWKIYDFLPSKQLSDDDTTEVSQGELLALILTTIQKSDGTLKTNDELYTKMLTSEDFNKEKFWRFNTNKLKNILGLYYLEHPELTCIEDIYTKYKT